MKDENKEYMRALLHSDYRAMMSYLCGYVGDESVAGEILCNIFVNIRTCPLKFSDIRDLRLGLWHLGRCYALDYLKYGVVVKKHKGEVKAVLSDGVGNFCRFPFVPTAEDEELRDFTEPDKDFARRLLEGNLSYEEAEQWMRDERHTALVDVMASVRSRNFVGKSYGSSVEMEARIDAVSYEIESLHMSLRWVIVAAGILSVLLLVREVFG